MEWTTVFSGRLFDLQQTDPGQPLSLERAVCADVVRVYPVSSVADELLMITEHRPDLEDRWITRAVSGSIEAGESPLDAAARELLEETGFAAEDLVVFHVSTPMLKVVHRVFHVVAFEPRRQGLPTHGPDERIGTLTIPLDRIPETALSAELEEDIVSFGLIQLWRYLGRTLS